MANLLECEREIYENIKDIEEQLGSTAALLSNGGALVKLSVQLADKCRVLLPALKRPAEGERLKRLLR
jgi:hypothetical protein